MRAVPPRRIVLTGGPGGGKTAILEVVRRTFEDEIVVVPETAGILFRGGFPREPDVEARASAQRAIFRVQIELEHLFETRAAGRALLCDRGTVDGLAYWPKGPDEYWREVGTTREEQLARYDLVLHVEPTLDGQGYKRDAVRLESAWEAAEIDLRIAAAWRDHPRYVRIARTPQFISKVRQVLTVLEEAFQVDQGGAPTR